MLGLIWAITVSYTHLDVYKRQEQYLPHIDNKGKTIGFYTLHTPRAQEKSRIPSKNNKDETKIKPELKQSIEAPTNNDIKLQQNNQPSTSKSGITAARIAQAIDGEEFNLYCQKIIPIKSTDASSSHYEILIRMHEEENSLMPPGSFLSLIHI